MVAQNPVVETITGTVGKVNDNGFTLTGRNGWLNISKYGEPTPRVPAAGAKVIVGLDKAGYVRSVRIGLDKADFARDSNAQQTHQNGHSAPEEPPWPTESPASPEPASAPVDRDTRIMRQAVLNTAVHILSAGGGVAPVDEVLDIAAELEAWVTR